MSNRNPQAEAAAYRVKLREVERQRDALKNENSILRAQIIRAEANTFTASLIQDDGGVNIKRLRQELAQQLVHAITLDTRESI
ncbi:hypothetical protein ICL81_04535 [Leucobacter sp. cx-328]|uniref:hypothetical protein n=1 Tax=unclassified Leucobacter TaxID=2621730 RepID=UPI00165D4CED|nr:MULTISPECIES: hypothetical protein [unclassified Leucobacter]MBC9943793.1 hypothetical protein [Leucobacter sp. cx-328]